MASGNVHITRRTFFRPPPPEDASMRALLRFLRDDGGPTAVEYAVMLALILLTCFAAIASVGDSANFMWNDLIKNGLDGI